MFDEEKAVVAGRVGREEEERVRERTFGLQRLINFSDGVFSIAITLLAFVLPIPDIKTAS